MSIATALTALAGDIDAARAAVEAKGGSVTEDGGSSQLAEDIATIPSGGLPYTDYTSIGLSAATFQDILPYFDDVEGGVKSWQMLAVIPNVGSFGGYYAILYAIRACCSAKDNTGFNDRVILSRKGTTGSGLAEIVATSSTGSANVADLNTIRVYQKVVY